MMKTKTIAALMLAGLVGATACGGEDAPGGLESESEEVDFNEESELGGDAGSDLDVSEQDAAPDDEREPEEDQEPAEECDAAGQNCQSEERGIEFALRPDRSDITRSHIAWLPVEGAAYYEMRVMQNNPATGGREAVYEKRTEGLHIQVPEAFRDQPDSTVEISAKNAEGESLADGEIVLPYAMEPDTREITCEGACRGKSYGYQLRLWSDTDGHGNALVELSRLSSYYIAYSPGAYHNFSHEIESWQHVYTDTVTVGMGEENVYDPSCNALSGEVYFVEANAGPWADDAAVQTTTSTLADDGEALCGIYSDFNGLRILYNANAAISPGLTCEAACDSSGVIGSGSGVGSGWPWGTIDDFNLPREIIFNDGRIWSNDEPTGPGWADDIPLTTVLEALMPNIFDINIEGEEWELHGLSIRSAVDPERDSQIDLDLELLQRQGPEYLYPLLDELEEGLYVLTQYYGGTKVYPMALMHERRSGR